MKTLQKSTLLLSLTTLFMLSASYASHNDGNKKGKQGTRTMKISITNISNTVLTPPIVALCNQRMDPIASVGSPASSALEPLAESGDTTALSTIFTNNGCSQAASATPVLPGETVTLEVQGNRRSFLHTAAMILPTNDGFIYASGIRVKRIKWRGQLGLKSYDAGTEFNDEVCTNIPGPQCGGEGFNAEREANNFVKPHPGLQGVADVSAATFNWGEPVAYITVN